MLKKVNTNQNALLSVADLPSVRIADASFPAPFKSGLEYSSPARGTWNIVHTGMLVPECHIIYVCAAGCLRGVVLTAAEMGTIDRFSNIVVRENNLLDGDMEDLIIEGVTDIIGKLPKRPPAVMVHTSCIHHFTGTDLGLIYRELRSRFPDIDFTDGYMTPIMRKSGLTPDQLMRTSIYKLLHEREAEPGVVSIIGGDMPTLEDSDLMQMLRAAGLTAREITSCKTYEEYQQLAGAEVFISCYPDAAPGGDTLAERLCRPHYKLKFSFDYDEIDETFGGLADLLAEILNRGGSTESAGRDPVDGAHDEGSDNIDSRGVTRASGEFVWTPSDIAAKRAACEAALKETKELIGDTPVAIDYTYCTRPLGLAELLLDHGFNVTRVYADSLPGPDRPAFDYLREKHPDLMLLPTVHAGMRFANSAARSEANTANAGLAAAGDGIASGAGKCRVLAIGQKAAYFENTNYFVNVVENGGMNGYEAITRTCELMRDAYINEKDMRSLVQIKGLGCDICVRD